MKKLYRKGTVHPTPPLLSDQLLSFLPATILSLTVALSLEDKEVLAYLISSSSSTNFPNNHRKAASAAGSGTTSSGGTKVDADHPPSFNCYCFRCYMNYWAKWNSSPNRELIHEVIDAFEDTSPLMQNKKDKSKRERRKGKSARGNSQGSEELKKPELSSIKNDFVESKPASESSSAGCAEAGDIEEVDDGKEEELEKGSVRNFVSFLGEKIWGVWT